VPRIVQAYTSSAAPAAAIAGAHRPSLDSPADPTAEDGVKAADDIELNIIPIIGRRGVMDLEHPRLGVGQIFQTFVDGSTG
jgi:hypothetical protein